MWAWIAIYAALGAAGTWLARAYALHRRMIDEPGERRSHSVATPRGGGIAIVAALLIATVAVGVRFPAHAPLAAAFGLGLILIAGIGWVDDHRPLSPWLRLGVHALASALLGAAVGVLQGDPWLGLAAFALAIGLTNVWNFMDGINGMAASQAALVAVALAWLGGPVWSWLALALAAACLGFLPFNFPRARIFMGDVGSGAIGYALAGLAALAASGLGSRSALLLWPLAAFMVDAGLTLLSRVRRGERWWTPHTQHAYQVWARRVGHTRVTLAYAAFTLLAVVSLRYVTEVRTGFILGMGAAWYMSGAFFWWLIRRTETPDRAQAA
ncbi:lipopolysaccharide biosynthesis protein [Lysobacter sp. BMK333-48F3]|uniref:lipopolysaccharide biosynthesis protein n=1 Tax=Lysobacter sp. BMK333-48F3 TaxID=2867962 RepID=UPI001C8BFA74|nr:lipopolysaccharide biosynthesis protein [Lysobacter sp. BMK333-48F3]MBX9402928.1 lipopolysaccharide biosynthesis protein [Lysobacter sp. BMK333-48F3]